MLFVRFVYEIGVDIKIERKKGIDMNLDKYARGSILCMYNLLVLNSSALLAGLLTPFLIGSYHEIFTCSTNYDKALKMLHHKCVYETIFLTSPLIGSINIRTFILTYHQVVPMVLNSYFVDASKQVD